MLTIIILICIALLGGGPAQAGEPEPIGVYDSRAIAICWAGTEPFKAEITDLKRRHREAVESGDTGLAAELEAEGLARQHKLHQQGFSTARVDDIMTRFEAEFDAVMKEAGVTALISKWDEAGLARYPEAGRVDLTRQLAEAMKPDDRQLAVLAHLDSSPPVPLEEIKEHSH